MPDISNDDDMRKAVDLAKSLYTPSPNETATQGALLPVKRYESGRVEFDPTAGVLGQISELGSGIKNLMTGSTPVFQINDQGETVPNPQAIGTALNVAGNIMGGGIPASALERSGGMMLGTSGTRMLPEAAAVELAKRQLSPVGLYSHGAEAAMAIPQAKGVAEQMVGMLRKQPSVSENELINAGILTPEGQLHPDFASRGTITREDLSSHLQSRMPQVEESILKPSSLSPEEQERLFDLEEFPFNVLSENEVNEMERLREIYDGEYKTKYESYTLPGGENYREVLLKLKEPEIKGKPYHIVRNETFIPALKRAGVNPQDEDAIRRSIAMKNNPRFLSDPDKEKAEAAIKKLQESGETDALNAYVESFSYNDAVEKQRNKQFQSSHWDEPNVLAHIRMADRTGPNGEKILHVEEVQSDWGQKGKKEGFRSSADVNQFKIKEMPGFNSEYNDFFDKWELSTDNQQLGNISKVEKNGKTKFVPNLILRQDTPHKLGAFNTYEDAINAVKNLNVFGYKQTHSLNQIPIDAEKLTALYLNKDEALKEASKHGIPSAPYVTSTQGWTDLALKRILKEAAEGGYDKVVWTPGVEQAGRYDLSKQIDELMVTKNTNGTFSLSATLPGGGVHKIGAEIPSEKLPDYVGKEMSEKIRNQEFKSDVYSADDLKVGGEGMKEYYDKILPNRLQSVAKKHDKNAKVQYTDVMLPPSGNRGTNNPPIQAPGLDITPQMRESILKGQGAFMDGGRVGYAGKGKVKEDDTVRSALDIARQYEDPANRIEADIRALTQNLSGLDIASAFPAFNTGLPQRPQVGGAGLIPKPPVNTQEGQFVLNPKLSEFKTGTPISEMTAIRTPTGELLPKKPLDLEAMYKSNARIFPAVGDRTLAGHILNMFGRDINLQGGPGYMETGKSWASDYGKIKGFASRMEKALQEGETPYMMHVTMGPQSGDFSKMTSQAILSQLPTSSVGSKAAKEKVQKFDDAMKKINEDWPGLRSKKLEDFLDKSSGEFRSAFAKEMDKSEYHKAGFPDVALSRFSVTDPVLLYRPTGLAGYATTKVDPSLKVLTGPEVGHETYTASLKPAKNAYQGTLDYLFPAREVFSDYLKNQISPKSRGDVNMEMYALERAFPSQKLDQQTLDRLMNIQDLYKKFGPSLKAEGGRTMGNNAVDNALRMARDHFDFGGDVRGGDSPFMSRSDYGLRSAPTPSFREAEDRSMREYNRAVESGWSPTGGGSDRSQSPLESTMTGRSQGFEGAPPVNMPSNIGELLGYNRARQQMMQQRQQQQSEEQEAENQRIKDALAMASVGQTSFDQTGILPSGFPPVEKQPVYWGGTPSDLPQSTIDRAMQLMQAPNVMGLPAGTTLGRTEMPLQAEMAGSPQETYDQMFARSTFAPQVNAQFAMAGSPYAVTPSAPTTMIAGLNRPAFPHTPTPKPEQVAQVATQPDVSASVNQPFRATSTAPQQVTQNVPLPPNVVRDAVVAASSPPVVVASAPQPVIDAAASDQDALVLGGRKTFELPKNAPMPMPRPSDVRESNPIAAVIDSIKSDLARQEGERINALEAAGKTATYPGYSTASDPLAAQRAYLTDIGLDPNNPADMAKVKARIIQQDGQDKVDYYTKSLSEALFGAPSEEQKVAAALTAAREGGGGGDRTPVQQVATQAPTVTPPPYTTELSEGNLALPHPEGLSAQQWANKYAGGDINKVHARIKFINGAPTLEYYTV